MNIPQDRLSPKERMEAFVKGGPLDRIPCSPFLVGQNIAPLYGYTSNEYHHSAEIMAEVILAAFREFRPDGVYIGIAPYSLPEALGARLSFDVNSSVLVKPAITDYAALEDMEPADPYTGGRLPLFLEALEILKSKAGDEVPVGAGCGGPFTAALLACGIERALRDMRRKPEAIHKALELTTVSLMRYIDAAVAIGVGVSVSESFSSYPVISREQFETFVLPYLKRLVDYIWNKHQKTVGIHLCGRSKPIWPQMAESGIVSLSVDETEDLGEASEIIGHRMTLVGNVPPVTTLLQGSVGDVYREARLCIQKGRDSPKGYILSSGCDIPMGTPRENIMALMDAARIYGRNGDDTERA